MGKIESFEDLEVWQLARVICQDVYQLFLNTPLGKDFELRNQMNRSSGSIMDNIAEGFGRNGNNEFKQYLSIAKGSCTELCSQLFRCLDRKYISKEQFDLLMEKTNLENKKLGSFISYLSKSVYKGSKFYSEPKTPNPKP